MCELSSFQLEGVERFRSDVAVLLNVTPDHLDRHGTFEPYAAAKLRVFERQRAGDTAVLCVDDAYVAALSDADVPGDATKLRVSGADLGPFEEAFAASRLRGPHNRANTACAIAVARALGAGEAGAADALRTFAAPAHRSRRCASCAACATSTIPRRRTSRRRCRRSPRSTRRCT